jgi:type I restriction enzyme S subunit
MNNISTDGRFDWSKIRRVPFPAKGLNGLTAQTGDVLFNHTNSPELVGKTAYFAGHNEVVTFSNHFLLLRPRSERLEGRYLAPWLSFQWQRHVFQGMCRQWVNQATVSREHLLALTIPLPPLNEQRRIAAILDAADALRTKRRAAIAKLDQLSASIFFIRFGKSVTEMPVNQTAFLADVTTRITDGVHQKPTYTDSGIPFISVKNITTGVLQFENCKYISRVDHDKFTRRCKAEKGDVLYTKVGATYGRPALVETDREFSLYVSVCLIKPKRDLIEPAFLCAALGSLAVKRQADQKIKGIGVPDLHLDQIQSFIIPKPPLDEQRKYVADLSSIEIVKSKQATALEMSDAFFASLQQSAFRGEL